MTPRLAFVCRLGSCSKLNLKSVYLCHLYSSNRLLYAKSNVHRIHKIVVQKSYINRDWWLCRRKIMRFHCMDVWRSAYENEWHLVQELSLWLQARRMVFVLSTLAVRIHTPCEKQNPTRYRRWCTHIVGATLETDVKLSITKVSNSKDQQKKTLKILFVIWKWCCMQMRESMREERGGMKQMMVLSSKRYCQLCKVYMKFDMKFDHKSQANSINAAMEWHNTTR